MPIADIVAQKKEAAIQEIVTKQQAKDQLEDQAHTLVATTNATNTVLTAYLAYTGLPPSQPDLTTWVDFLVKGGSTTTLIATLAKNPAYLANTAGSAVNAVQYAFHNLFGREANAGDLAYWLPLATNPSFPMKLAAAASPADAWALAQRVQFLDGVDGLLNGADPTAVQYRGALAYTLSKIHFGGETAEQALVDFNHLLDPNAQTLLEQLNAPYIAQQQTLALDLAFLAYLRRPPTMPTAEGNTGTPGTGGTGDTAAAATDEYTIWTTHLKQANGNPDVLLQTLASSSEFAQIYSAVGGDLSKSIDDLYHFLFGRAASADEIANWVGWVNANPTKNYLLPWQIAVSASGTDYASLQQKLLVVEDLKQIEQSKGLDASDPHIKPIVMQLLGEVSAYPDGKTAQEVIQDIDLSLGYGMKPTPPEITSVMRVGDTLSITFDQAIDWNYLDKNHDGKLAIESELIVGAKGVWEAPEGASGGETIAMTKPLGSNPTAVVSVDSQGKILPSSQLVVKMSSDADLVHAYTYTPPTSGSGTGTSSESITEIPTLTEVVVIGIKDLDGQIGDAAMSL